MRGRPPYPVLLVCALGCASGLFCALGCASGAPAPKPPASRPPPSPPAAPVDPRLMDEQASFAELVALAGALHQRGEGEHDAGCLLTEGATGLRLSADLLSAFEPIPEPPPSLKTWHARLDARVGVIDAFGEPRSAALVLAPFTSAPRAATTPLIALLLGADGVWLRYSNEDASAADNALPIAEVVPRLLTRAPQGALIYITAEADTPVRALHALLAELPDARPAALAVALPEGTRLPVPPEPSETAQTRALCPDGLPELDATAPLGDLDAAQLGPALQALREAASSCMRRTLWSGRLVLALRIDPEGRLADACALPAEGASEAQAAEGASESLAACLTRAATSLPFPAPSPPGFVDLHLPLSLQASNLRSQRALCAADQVPQNVR